MSDRPNDATISGGRHETTRPRIALLDVASWTSYSSDHVHKTILLAQYQLRFTSSSAQIVSKYTIKKWILSNNNWVAFADIQLYFMD